MALSLRAIEAWLPNRRKRKKHERVEQATARPGEVRNVKIPKRG